jgi:hypothetical protein
MVLQTIRQPALQNLEFIDHIPSKKENKKPRGHLGPRGSITIYQLLT